MKDLKKLEGAKMLSKAEQRIIKGGGGPGEVCSGDGPLVVCYFPAQCTQDVQGNWYCA